MILRSRRSPPVLLAPGVVAGRTPRLLTSHLRRSLVSLAQEGMAAPPLTPPPRPVEGECCGSGCANCVWVTYWEQCEDYERRRKALQRLQQSGKLDQHQHQQPPDGGGGAQQSNEGEDGMDAATRAFIELEKRLAQQQGQTRA